MRKNGCGGRHLGFLAVGIVVMWAAGTRLLVLELHCVRLTDGDEPDLAHLAIGR